MQPTFPLSYHGPNPDSLQELVTLKEYVEQERQGLPQDSEIQNLIDEIAQSIDSTIYKLKFLK
jgi:Tfp pilus assembly protein PilO